jgi:lactate dehydrogenase-like 2-hydroxyacid dehydrogenase
MPEPVLVTEPEFRKGEEFFRAAPDLALQAAPADESRLAETIAATNARAVVIGARPYTGPLYAALGHTGGAAGALLARFGVGHDGVDKRLTFQHGIVVTNTPGVLDASVAEHTLWLMGSLARRVASLDSALRAGQFFSQAGIELSGKTLGLLGCGGIARRVATIAHFGFGMHVLACGRRTADELAQDAVQPPAELFASWGLDAYTTDPDRVLREADVVSIHLPATPATRQFIDARRLALLKPSALLINTARGSVLDEHALYDALAAGQFAGAALDVFVVEPYLPTAPDKDLRRLPNVVLTPHAGSNTREANHAMAAACLANLRHFFAGRLDQLTRVDPSTRHPGD